jgi:antitoxin component YwqK of YwqJK toxin-antitoxin module
MKKLLILLSLLLSIHQSNACFCSESYWSTETILKKEHIYIGLVKVLAVIPITTEVAPQGSRDLSANFYKIRVKEITHYKGKKYTEIIVFGSVFPNRSLTSCDLHIKEGEEWFIFSDNWKSGLPLVGGLCSLSRKYKDKDGLKDWGSYRLKNIALLDSIFGKTKKTPSSLNGQKRTYYANGKVETVMSYHKGKLHHKALYFYPSGKILGEVSYENGIKNGDEIWYYPSGNIKEKRHFRQGVPVNVSIYYSEKGGISYPRTVRLFNSKGVLIRFQEYQNPFREPYVNRLYSDTIYKPESKEESRTYWFDNQSLTIANYQNGKLCGQEISYTPNGETLRIIAEDENGKRKILIDKLPLIIEIEETE